MTNIRFAASVFAASLAAAAATARAEIRTYTLNPTSSTLRFSGSVSAFAATPQTAGSDTTRYSGTLMVDVTTNTIRFLNGSVIDAQPQSIAQAPAANGAQGTAQADYGYNISQPPFDSGQAAIRNLVLDVESGVLTRTGTSFPSGQTVLVDSGVLDYRVTGLTNENGRESQVGEAATNAAAAGSLTVAGTTETLTLPINANFRFTAIDLGDSPFTATGQLVATRVIPEPGSAGLLAAAGAAAVLAVRRRARGTC